MGFVDSMTVKSKLVSLVSLLLVLLSGVAGFALFMMNSIATELYEISEEDIPPCYSGYRG